MRNKWAVLCRLTNKCKKIQSRKGCVFRGKQGKIGICV